MGNYDYETIAVIAVKRFVEGYNTMELLDAATSQREKEAVIFVSLLHLDDEALAEFDLSCDCGGECKTIVCRNKLKNMLGGYLDNNCYH